MYKPTVETKGKNFDPDRLRLSYLKLRIALQDEKECQEQERSERCDTCPWSVCIDGTLHPCKFRV